MAALERTCQHCEFKGSEPLSYQLCSPASQPAITAISIYRILIQASWLDSTRSVSSAVKAITAFRKS